MNSEGEFPAVKSTNFDAQINLKIQSSVLDNNTDSPTKGDTNYQSELGKIAPSE